MRHAAISLVLATSVLVAGPASAMPTPALVEGQVVDSGAVDTVPGSYLVVLRDPAASATLVTGYGGSVRFTYRHALRGFAVRATEAQARRLAGDSRVAYVAADRTVRATVFVQANPPSWGLDRIDDRSLPLDAKYHFPSEATSVRAYVIDTGIRFTHQEFGGRATLGIDTVGDGQNGNDCNGHGTHVAGTLGGRTVGVAKGVRLISVRVLGCGGVGTIAQVIAGVDWVTGDAPRQVARSVANMSLGGAPSVALDAAITNSINANVHYSVAAGGSNADACNFSPARVPRATTVGGTDQNDVRGPFSNFGGCVDVFAPATQIVSASITADNAYIPFSGTSMSTPHAAGVAALWRHRFPADTADQVAGALVANATPGVVVNPGPGSPNLLLYSGTVPM